jgi:hypothetical protein
MKKMFTLLLCASLLAGCSVPTPDDIFDNNEEVVLNGWDNLTGEFTVIVDENNSTVAPIITLGSNNTWLEVNSFNYTATHLSFEIVNNTVIFNNYTFNNPGYLIQDGFMLSEGYAPNYGSAELHFPVFPFDITINYTVVYREWNGR